MFLILVRQNVTPRRKCRDLHGKSTAYGIGQSWIEYCLNHTCTLVGQNPEIKLKAVSCDYFKCNSENQRKDYCCSVCDGGQPYIYCGAKDIKIDIPKAAVGGYGTKSLSLIDSKCKPAENKTHVSFHMQFDSCGTTKSIEKDSYKYSNRIKSLNHSLDGDSLHSVTRQEREIDIEFSCTYQIVRRVGTFFVVKEGVTKSSVLFRFTTPGGMMRYRDRNKSVKVFPGSNIFFHIGSKIARIYNLLIVPQECDLVPKARENGVAMENYKLIQNG